MQVMQTDLISAGLRNRFEHARRVLVLTGAGISAESGVPTFRGVEIPPYGRECLST